VRPLADLLWFGPAGDRTPDPVRYLLWLDAGRRPRANTEREPRLALHVTQDGRP
jgi:hypothetical protein